MGEPGRPTIDDLPSIFEHLGLSSNESRILATLLRLGAGSAAQIASETGVHRSNAYPVLESLRGQNLVEYRAGKVARWVCPGRDEVVRRLCTARVQRLGEAAARVEAEGQEALRVLATLGPEEGQTPLPYVHLIGSDLQAVSVYNRYIEEAEEVLVCNREPYPGPVVVYGAIVTALGRGMRARALYRASELEERHDVREVAGVYARAGAESRIVEDLPMAMAVFDRKIVLAMLPDPIVGGTGPPTNLYVEHPGFAGSCVASFEQLWAGGRAFSEVVPGSSSSKGRPRVDGARLQRSTRGAEVAGR